MRKRMKNEYQIVIALTVSYLFISVLMSIGWIFIDTSKALATTVIVYYILLTLNRMVFWSLKKFRKMKSSND